MGPEMSDGYRIITIPGADPRLKPYLGIIYSNWLRTLRFTNDWFKLINRGVYYARYKEVIQMLLTRPDTQVNLAVLADDPDACIGWSVYEPHKLHYLFVRRGGRRQGIGTALMPLDINEFSHLTLPGVVIWKTKYPELTFNPFL